MRLSDHRDFRRTTRPVIVIGLAAFAFASAIAEDIRAAPMSIGRSRTTDFSLKSRWERALTTQAAIRQLLLANGPDSSAGAYPRSVREQLLTFYERRAFQPAWTGGPTERENAREVMEVLARAGEQGLRPQDYAAPTHWSEEPRQGKESAEYELAITDATLRYARHVAVGRVRPHNVYTDAQLPIPPFDAVSVLTQILRSSSIAASLAELPPPHPEYRRLVQALSRYRNIAAQGGWPSLPVDGEPRSYGKDDLRATLVKRLALEDPVFSVITRPTGDDVREAVERFQARNGLTADGRLTGATLAALNVPVIRRIEQIQANMERWRWLPREFEQSHITVNVPEQSLTFMRNGIVELSSKVIVGRKQTPTPILRTTILGAIANPAWEIPGDIVVNQVLPKLRRNPSYLASSNMVLVNGPANDPQGVRIDWRNVSAAAFPYRVVQIPGPTNALGRIMLDSPNDFDVYLHDTPGQAIFGRRERAVSNGCIRVEAIHQLTALALGTSDADQTIAERINSGKTQRLDLDEPLPVYLVYWTAVGIDDGAVEFHNDLYERDARLIAAIGASRTEEEEPAIADISVDPRPSPALADRISGFQIQRDGTRTRSSYQPAMTTDPLFDADALEDDRSLPEPTRLSRSTPSANVERNIESVRRTDSTKRVTEPAPRFPLLKRLFEGTRPRRGYSYR